MITADGQHEAIEAAAMALAAFDLEALKPLQLLALRYLVREIDVFVCFPTGFGKSMITSISYHLCAVTCGFTRFPPDPIVLVVFPLKLLLVISSEFCRREESLPL